MRKLGYRFRTNPADVDESPRSQEGPRRYVRRIATAKAERIASRFPSDWVVAADTAVVVERTILGKPVSDRDAAGMLRRLSGRWHRVLTAMVIARRADSRFEANIESTRVRFRRLKPAEIQAYVQSGEPFGKAGAYAIQGSAGLLIERIEGSYSNVVGFPQETFYDLARRIGFPLPYPFEALTPSAPSIFGTRER